MLERDWVAEEPELHLLPHIRRACAERGWTVRRAEVVAAVLEVDITMLGRSARTPTEAAYQLIGTFAEPSTHIVETKRDVGRDVEVGVTTGVLGW